MGRPTSLTPDVQARIVEALAGGNYAETAAAYAGIAPSTYHAWVTRGELEQARVDAGEEPSPSEAPFLEFLEAVKSARSKAEVRNVALIQQAARETWQAAAWWLERTRPKDWGRRVQTEVVGADGGAVQVASASPADLEDKVRAILAARDVPERDDRGEPDE